jgi:hypothetical protein
VFSSGAEITTPTSLGTLTCTTNNTDIGTLTGVRTGQATFTIRAGLTCTGIGTGNWTGTYTVTSPEGLGVTSDAAPTTTFEVGGVRKNEEVGIAATLRAGNTAILKDTLGFTQNTCSGSTAEGHTESPFTGATVGGPVTSLSFSSCTTEGVVVHRAGTLSVQWIRGTTNGTVFSSGAEVTVPVPGGSIITCTTNNTDIGTLTGVRTGQATFTIRAGLTCTGIGTGNWTGTYTVTSPEGLGVTE